jgi:catecholate siderophore receptor
VHRPRTCQQATGFSPVQASLEKTTTENSRMPASRSLPPFALRPLAAALGVAALLPMTQALAQSAKPDAPETTLPEVKATAAPEETFRKETTRSATRTETELRDIPQFINTVTQPLIRSQNATSLSDALRNVPGITYAAGEGGTQANQVFYLRGFPAGGDIFIDSVRDLGEYNRDLFSTDSVEVLKGPSALAFGRGSPGGVINQVSKVPDLSNRAEAALTLGSFSQKRLTGDLNSPFGDSNAMRLIALEERTHVFRYPQGVSREGFAPSVKLGMGAPYEVTLAYYYLRTKDVTDYGQPTLSPAVTGTGLGAMPPVSPRNYYGFADADYAHHQTNIATMTIDHAFSNDASLRNTTRVARYQRQVEATIPSLDPVDRFGNPISPATPLADLLVIRNHDGNRTRDNDDTAFINQTDVSWKIEAGAIVHRLQGGLELARERLDRWNYTLDTDPVAPGVQIPSSVTSFLDPDPYTPISYTKTPNIRARAQGDTAAIYAQDQLELSREWNALAGLRFERYRAEARTESYATGAVATGPFARTDNMLSGRAGLIWQPSKSQSYYVSAGNSYNPSGELGVYGATGTNLNATNEDLAPEKNVGYEMGGTWDFGPGAELRAALFRNEKTNARMMNEIGQTVLTGLRRIDGLEVQLSGRLRPDWDIYAGIAYMDGTIVNGAANVQGNVPLGVATFSGNLWTVYRLGGGWEVGGGVRGTSGFWLNDANTAKVPRYAVVDATAAYVHVRYEVRFNVQNLGDETYYVGGYQNSANRVLPGSPRAYSLTLRYFF